MDLIEIKNCTLKKNALEIREGLPYNEWEKIGKVLRHMEGSVQFWIGDWIRYGERTYKGVNSAQYDKAIEETGLERRTLQDIKYVAQNVSPTCRREGLSFSHHKEIAQLEPEQQKKFLDLAEQNQLTRNELRAEVKKAKFKQAPSFPSGKYQVLYIDPPWDVKAGPEWGSNEESRDLIYPTMTLDEITNLPIDSLADTNAHLYIWTINKYIPETYQIIASWGFQPSCLLTWCKPPHGIGLGGTYIQTTEHLLFCRRGTLEALKRIDSSWFSYPRGAHSVKPEAFRKMIEEVSPGNRIEIFARKQSHGWDVWGNEV